MRAGHRKVKRDLKSNWPEGWEAEAQRLASLYERTIDGITEFDEEVAKRRQAAQKLTKLKVLAGRFSRGFLELVEGDDADELVRMHWTRSARSELTYGGAQGRSIAYLPTQPRSGAWQPRAPKSLPTSMAPSNCSRLEARWTRATTQHWRCASRSPPQQPLTRSCSARRRAEVAATTAPSGVS